MILMSVVANSAAADAIERADQEDTEMMPNAASKMNSACWASLLDAEEIRAAVLAPHCMELRGVLAICVVANLVREDAVSRQITLLLFGGLVAIGVGRAILDPATSPASLSRGEDARFRHTQHVVGFVISSFLALVIMLTPVRETALVWLFAPIIALPYALVIRARITKE